MPSPFPGMDPYLEDPTLWPHVHTALIMALHDDLGTRLPGRYYVAAQERVYRTTYDDPYFAYPDLALGRAAAGQGPQADRAAAPRPSEASGPQAGHASEAAAAYREGGGQAPAPEGARTVFVPVPREMRERYLEIRRVGSGEVVTFVEILSPGNKRPGRARNAYEAKRGRVLASRTHLVEIDLLRSYAPMPMVPEPQGVHYRILVSRSHERPRALLYAFSVRQPIPEFPLPLDRDEVELTIRLGPLLGGLYDRARFALRIDYSKPPIPPLDEEDARWAAEVLRGLRQAASQP